MTSGSSYITVNSINSHPHENIMPQMSHKTQPTFIKQSVKCEKKKKEDNLYRSKAKKLWESKIVNSLWNH